MFEINLLSAEQRRQLIDVQQVFDSYRARRELLDNRYAGSMRWVEQGGREYLLRKRSRAETSLGPRSPETEGIHRQFLDGRTRVADEARALEARLEEMAPVNVALGLGRVPKLAARLMRRLHEAGLLGRHIHVVGTNALYAYEVRAGVRLQSGLLATGDADLLLDARRRLRLALEDVRQEGVLGIIRKVDRSFAPRAPGDFRAVNRDGYLVDLIRPQTRRVMSSSERDRIGESADDLRGSPIHGLNWLVNAPKFAAVAIDEAGFPVPIDTVDPRAFALHKAWVSELPDRDPVKKVRDRSQAVAVATLAARHLGLSFDGSVLSALPQELRALAPLLLKDGDKTAEGARGGRTPDWW